MKSDMMGVILACAFLGVIALLYAIKQTPPPTQCHTFQRTETSHIRLNSCTGEAHIVVRGANGFEWQRIND